jgi:HAD superfamily hydrolase (TIGR01459 family)
MRSVPIHRGLSALAPDYEAFIVDLWGVLHDGVAAFPEAVACLEQLKAHGKRVLILSNAPRRAAAVAQRTVELGVAAELFDAVVSSGEAVWQNLEARRDPWYRALGRRCYHLGPERDFGMREGLDLDFVAALAAADFILNTGALSTEDTAEDYAALLEEARGRGLPMVCANPDLEVIRGGRREICAGELAAFYERLGGEVRYDGKPHRSIYEACFEALDLDRPETMLAIGDSLRTDIAGAQAVGMAGLFVAGGIHAEELGMAGGAPPDEAALAALFRARDMYPLAVLDALRW